MTTNEEEVAEELTEEAEETEEVGEALESEETAEETVEKVEEEEEEEEKEELEENIVEERIYTVPLQRAWISPRGKRAPRAIRILKGFVERHMKPESIMISQEVNERIWRRGIQKPPRKIRIRAAKDQDGKVFVHLAEGD